MAQLRQHKAYFHSYDFSPLYTCLQKYFDNPHIDTILIYGGKSSSKSYTVAQRLCIELLRGLSSIAFRKETSRLATTLVRTYGAVIEQLNLSNAIETYRFEYRNGKNQIKLSGLDDEGKIKGIENYKYLSFEELDQFTYDEFTQGSASLRGQDNQKVIATWNPVSANSWVKTKLIDQNEWIDVDHCLPSPDSFIRESKDGHSVLIKTDYKDNYWIVGHPSGDNTKGFRDDRLIRLYEGYKLSDPHFYKVNVLGEWGVVQNDSPFFYNFKREKHCVRETKPNLNFPLRISFDFNIGSTYCIIYQMIPLPKDQGGGFFVYSTLKGNDTKDLCKVIKRHFGWTIGAVWGNTRNVIITGDSTGKNRTAVAGNIDNYMIILKELKLSRSSLRDVSGVNARHVYSRTIVNNFLVAIPTFINSENNTPLIYDLETAYFDDETSNIKKDRKDNPQDAGDAFRYAVNECVPGGINEIEKYSKLIDPDYYLNFI